MLFGIAAILAFICAAVCDFAPVGIGLVTIIGIMAIGLACLVAAILWPGTRNRRRPRDRD